MSRPYLPLDLVLVPVRALSLPHVLVLLVLVPVPVRALSLPLSGVSVLSPGHRDLLSPGKVLSSPGERDLLSPGSVLLSPGHRDLLSPGSVLLSPGHRDLLSPGSVLLSPGHRDLLSPGERDLLSPGERDLLSPGKRDLLSPGERDLLSPGKRDLLSPGKVLSSPGERDLLSPGSVLLSPGHRDLLSPGHREVLVPVWSGSSSGVAVQTSCEQNRMRVSVSRGALGPAGAAPPTHLRLGTCAVSRSTEDQIHFEYDLDQCGTRRAMISDRLVYFNLLHYAPPPPPGPIRRAAPFSLPVACYFHRTSQTPDIQTPKLQTPDLQTQRLQTPKVQTPRTSRPMKLTGQPTLTPCNALWEELSELDHYVLGEPVYFEARVPPSPRNQRLYVHSCHVTPERPPPATPRLPLVGNNGCLLRNEEDEGGCSRFFPSSRNAVRFSVDAFLFQGTNGRLRLHCALSVGGPQPTPAAKACHYLPHAHRWVEVDGPDSVCACCESQCSPAPPTETRWVSSRPWTVLEPPPQGRAPPTAPPTAPGGAWPFRGRGVTWVEEGEQTKGWAIVEEEEEEEEEDPNRMFEGDFVFGK